MPGYDGSIVFETAIDNKAMERELNSLKKKIQSLNDKIYMKQQEKLPLVSQFEKLSEELDGAKWKLANLKSAGAGKTEIADQAERVKLLQGEYNKVYSSLERIDASIRSANLELEMAEGKAEAIKSKLGGKNLLTGLRKAASGLLATLGKVAKTISGKAWKSLKTMFSGSGKSGKGILGDMGKFLSYSFGIRTLYTLFSKLRSAMSEGMKNLANFSTGANASISSMKSALAQLKNSFATAFAPILTVVAPIITSFIDIPGEQPELQGPQRQSAESANLCGGAECQGDFP